MTSINRRVGAETRPTGSEAHRLDIEGLRALAVGIVVLYHAGVPFLGGGYVGVDVFFVVSGFLITGLLVREMETTGTLDLARFYARRIRRLLPASVLTLVSVAVLAALVLPQTRWASVAGDIRWSSGYLVNWRFADRAVDYLAATVAPSPVQHFWSLAVEEQFYLVWPFLLLTVTLAARRRNGNLRQALGLGLLAVAVPSLVWSIVHTPTSPGAAYFVTTTRMWELAIGGGLAIAAPFVVRVPRAISSVLAAGGLIGIGLAAVTFGETTLFPGYAALLPVLSTAVVVAGGTAHRDTAAARLLSLRPLVVVGGFSYAIYLWHWPLLVMSVAIWGQLSVALGLVVVAVATVISWLTFTAFEQPIRRSAAIITPPRRGLVLGLVLTGAGVAAGFWLSGLLPNLVPPAVAQPVVPVPVVTTTPAVGATTTSPPGTTTTPAPPEIPIQQTAETITPDPLVAGEDLPTVYTAGCHQNQTDSEPVSCHYGALEGPTVALVGDSHAAMWVPAFQVLADEYGFQLVTYTKSACPFSDAPFVLGAQRIPYESCYEWNDRLLELLIGDRPDLVVTSSFHKLTIDDPDGEELSVAASQAVLADGLSTTWRTVEEAGLALVVIRDVPAPGFDVPECVSEHRDDIGGCAYDRDAVMADNTGQSVAAAITGIRLVDLTDWICGPELCPAVIDDLMVWRDTHHLTATYARYLAPVLGSELERFLVHDTRKGAVPDAG